MFSKGLDQLRKSYGELGYINMVGTPIPRIDEAKKLIYLNIDIDEGKPFYVSRIEFTGNTITRDKVIRRELLLEEGQVYNSRLWDLSILRLNQLNYFDTLKADQDSESRQNADDGTVDLLLKLKEKGKNSIGLNGGISGLSGTFIGLNYETNNFLGLGETLSVQANVGDLSRNLSFGFTEPYLRNKPISLGVQVFTSKYDYNPAKSYGIANSQSQNLTNAQQSLLTNYNTVDDRTDGVDQRAAAASVGADRRDPRWLVLLAVALFGDDVQRQHAQRLPVACVPLGRRRAEPVERHRDLGDDAELYLLEPRPRGRSAQRQGLQRCGAGCRRRRQREVLSRRRSSYRQFFPMKGLKINREGHNVLGYRMQFAHVAGFGGEVAPPTNRIYSGGDQDVRGFDIRSAGAVHLHSDQGDVQPDQPGRQHGSARSDEPDAGQRPDSAADLPAWSRSAATPA